MSTVRHGFRGWWPHLNLFIFHLFRGTQGNGQRWSSQKPRALDSAKLEPRDLQASHSRLSPGLRVKGEISGNEDLFVEGSVEGVVHLSERRLMIGPTASLKADITAGEVLVRGNVRGNVSAKRRIEVGNEGSVIGDLTTRQVFIKEGARFEGSIRIENSPERELGDDALPDMDSAPPEVVATVAAGK